MALDIHKRPDINLTTGLPAAMRTQAPAIPQDWTVEEARKALGLTPSPSTWVGNVGDPDVFAENERRKIMAVLDGKLDGIQELIWNRVILAIWRGPQEKAIGNAGLVMLRTDNARDEDVWQGSVALVVAMGPLAFVREIDDETGAPIKQPQAPKVGDWVFFSRGYGTRIKINDVQCILLEKETEAIKMILRAPHVLDLT